MLDHQRFLNQDLVLNVSKSVNPAVFDINKYEGFLDALCGEREYQKTAIRNTLTYLLSGNYKSVADLAEENYHNNERCKRFTAHLNSSRTTFNSPINYPAHLTWQRERAKVMLFMALPAFCWQKAQWIMFWWFARQQPLKTA